MRKIRNYFTWLFCGKKTSYSQRLSIYYLLRDRLEKHKSGGFCYHLSYIQSDLKLYDLKELYMMEPNNHRSTGAWWWPGYDYETRLEVSGKIITKMECNSHIKK